MNLLLISDMIKHKRFVPGGDNHRAGEDGHFRSARSILQENGIFI